MSNNLQKQKKFNNKSDLKNNKSTKRAKSQRKYLNSPDLITQIPAKNYNSKNLYLNSLNLNLNYLQQQSFTPINNRKKLYEEQFLLPEKSSKFEGKKTLVLDIDETLVHSSFFPFEKNDLILNVNFDGIYYNIYVLIRPGAEKFIKNISKYFEVITFTASLPAYAKPLLDILDKGKNIQHRLYREHCTFINGVFIKDLKRLNRNLKDLIIVDNSPMAFAFDTENGLPILSWFDDPIDKELVNIQPLLEFLANTKDVRKYIKKFVKNNNINYEMAHKIIKESQDNQKNDNEVQNINFNNENDDEKIDINDNNNNNINNNKIQEKLLNNFIIKNDPKISALVNDDNKRNNDLTNIININNHNCPSNLKLDFSNILNNNKYSESRKKNQVKDTSNKNSAKVLNKKSNIFRLGIKINDNNNIIQINNNFNPQFIFNNNYQKLENDYKTKENILMPIIFSSSLNTTKNKNYHIQYNNLNEKNNSKQKNNFHKNKNHKNMNINNIQPISLKETLDDKISSVKQFKYMNLIDKFQDNNNKFKSSSLKILNKNKNDSKLKINTNINVGENSFRNNKYKLKNKKTSLNIKEQLKITNQKINEIINKDFNINNNTNKMNDLINQALRSKSTGNFIKLKSTHAKTSKNSINQYINNNLKWFNDEEKKILYTNNKNNNNRIELLSIDGYTPKNLKNIKY